MFCFCMVPAVRSHFHGFKESRGLPLWPVLACVPLFSSTEEVRILIYHITQLQMTGEKKTVNVEVV